MIISKQVARTADFAVRVFSVAIIAAVPYSSAVSNLRRPFLADRYFSIVVRLFRRRELVARTADFAVRVSSSHQRKAADRKYGGLRYPRLARAFNRLQQIRRQERRRAKRTLRFDRRPRENALRSARTNLIAPSRGRKDADHKSGGPRYPLPSIPPRGPSGNRVFGGFSNHKPFVFDPRVSQKALSGWASRRKKTVPDTVSPLRERQLGVAYVPWTLPTNRALSGRGFRRC